MSGAAAATHPHRNVRATMALRFFCLWLAIAVAVATAVATARAHTHKFIVRAIRDRSAWELTNGRLGAKHGARAVLVNANVAARLRELRPNEFDVQEYATPLDVRDNESNVVVVRFIREVGPADIGRVRAALRERATRVQKISSDRVAVVLARNASRAALEPLADVDAVAYVSGVVPFERHAVLEFQNVWGVADAWTAFLQTNTTVALADTGIDTAHCAFAPSAGTVPTALLKDTVLDPNATPDAGTKVRAYVSVCTSLMSDGGAGTCVSSTDASDAAQGHGTAMASVLAGTECVPNDPDAERGGVSGQIVFFDLLRGSGTYLVLPLNLADMFASAVAFGAYTFAASWGAGCRSSYDDTAIQVDTFVRANPLVLLVFSAGNCGNSLPRGMASPATAKNVLSVGASMSGSAVYVDGTRHFSSGDVVANAANYEPTSVASFTSMGYGLGSSVRRMPLVAAPGVMVSSAEAGTAQGFFLVSGTSPAAQVAAAILETIRVQLRRSGVEPTAATLRAAAVAVAVPATKTVTVGSTKVYPTSDDPRSRAFFGTLRPVFANESDWSVRQTSVSSFGVVSFCGSGRATVAVAWDDPPALAGSTRPLMNELFVIVTTAAGVAAADLDVDNNHKRVATPSDAWRLSIAADMMSAPQTVSVVAVGSSAGASALGSCADACAPLDAPRPLPCAAAHATGLRACVGGTAQCWPQTCDAGYEFQSGTTTCVAGAGTASCGEFLAWNGTACVCVGDVLCSDSSLVRCVDGAYEGPGSPACVVTRADVQQEYEYVSTEPFVVHAPAPSVAPWLAFAVAALEVLGFALVMGTLMCRRRKCLETNDVLSVAAFVLQAMFAVLAVALLETSVEASFVFLVAWLLGVFGFLFTVPPERIVAATIIMALVVLVVGLAESYSPRWGTNLIFLSGAFVVVATLMSRSVPEAYVIFACLAVVVGVWLIVAASAQLCNADADGRCTSPAHLGVAIAWLVLGLASVVAGVYMFDPCACTCARADADADPDADPDAKKKRRGRCRDCCRCRCSPDSDDTSDAAFVDRGRQESSAEPLQTQPGEVRRRREKEKEKE